MKVKVTQTIELDEVPDLLRDILNECAKKLDNCRKVKHSALVRNINDLQRFGTALHDLRSELSIIDSKLLDCWNISVGYEQAQSSQENIDAGQDDE